MEDAYKIQGGKPLRGTISVSGAKNVALKTIIAALLFDGEVVLKNIPRINDVTELLHLINSLGVKGNFTEQNTVSINADNIDVNKVDMLHASKIRVSFMLFAPLLHKFKECFVPNPGGCRIGARPIDWVIEGMKTLGSEITYDSGTGYYHAHLKKEVAGEYTFAKPTHTGTELLIMFAVKGSNTIVLHNAALEPEIDDLITFLNESGAHIVREGSTITIHAVSTLTQTKPYTVVADRNEAVTFAVLGIATNGEVTIDNIPRSLIEIFLQELEKVGAGVEELGPMTFKFFNKGPLRFSHIETKPHPGFMTDWQPNWAILMTQAEGESTIHERVFEKRFSYVREMKKLGAKIEFENSSPEDIDSYYFTTDPKKNYQQIIRITGPTQLHSGVLSINDLRAGASLVIAALIADGESIVEGASIVERGYENLVQKIQNIGGVIAKI